MPPRAVHENSDGQDAVEAQDATTKHLSQRSYSATKGVFANADDLRASIHTNIALKEYDVSDLYHEGGFFQAIARSKNFGTLTTVAIAINAAWIGLDAECNDHGLGHPIPGCPASAEDTDFWTVGENIFCVFFSLELLVRFMAFEVKCNACRDNWFRFDGVLVFLMVMENWVISLALGVDGEALGNLSLLKMLKLLRLTRMVRLMRAVPELVTLVKGMAIAARSVFYTLLLLVIFLYVFAIVFKSQLSESSGSSTLTVQFSGIPRSMWTLFWAGCLLDEISVVANLIKDQSVIMAAIFVAFVLISSLMVLNMLIGVLCGVVIAVAAVEKETALVNYVKSKLMSVLERLDEDGDGTISKVEFEKLVDNPEAVCALNELGVDVPNLCSLADHLFETEPFQAKKGSSFCSNKNQEKSNKDMTFAEFLEMVIRLRSENWPCVADIVELRKLIHKGQKQALRRFNRIERGQLELQQGIRMICLQLDSALALSQAICGTRPESISGYDDDRGGQESAVQVPVVTS